VLALENIPKLTEMALEIDGMSEEGSDALVSSMQSLVAKDRVDRVLLLQLKSNPTCAHHTCLK
jgi:hypothetical protein